MVNPEASLRGRIRELVYVATGRSGALDEAITQQKVDLLHAHFGAWQLVLLVWILVFAKVIYALPLVYALLLLTTVILFKEAGRKYIELPEGAVPDYVKAVNRRIGVSVIVVIFLVGMSAGMKGSSRFNNPLTKDTSPSIDTQRWLRGNTPVDALVLSPPTDLQFRIYSQRSIVGLALDSTYANISRAFALEMRERMADLLGFDRSIRSLPPLFNFDLRSGKTFRRKVEKKMKDHYAGLGAVRIMQLIEKYSVDYVVMYIDNRLPFSLLYENELYAVYGPFSHGE